MDTTKLKKILQAHTEWLLGNTKGTRADLLSANLQSADLRGADLRGANLGGANLQWANLQGANLGEYAIIQSGPLGSRHDYVVTLWNPSWESEQTRAGCWNGTLDALALRVEEVHKGTRYESEYRATIAYHRAMLTIAKAEKGA